MALTTVKVLTDVLKATREEAGRLRADFARAGTFVVDLIGGPGCGKTRLLEASLGPLAGRFRTAVLVGDVATPRDAERLAGRGAESYQLVTEGACHLSPSLVRVGVSELVKTVGALPELLIIENVGNLVCPAAWDLGEDAKIVLFSVTEGEDKPVKYPKIFRQARYAVLSKMDLLPHVPFSVEKAVAFARQVNPDLEFLFTSALVPGGLEEWYGFLRAQVRRRQVA